jgi:hypothetical protein
VGRPRVLRDFAELVAALERHTALLREYHQKAFIDGGERYLGEIAGKLRLLVYEHGRNKPLLLHLMDELKVESLVTVTGPPQFEIEPGIHGGDRVDLRTWLEMLSFAATATDGELLRLTKKQVIGLWAQQQGAAHEDWTLDESLVRLRDRGVFIGELPAGSQVLRGLSTTVLSVAEDVVRQLSTRRT